MDWNCIDYVLIIDLSDDWTLSFWQHSFTAEDPLVGKYSNTKYLWVHLLFKQTWENKSIFILTLIRSPVNVY